MTANNDKPTTIMPKGLEATVLFGFNAKDWAFTSRRIFAPTFKKQDPSGSGQGWINLRDSNTSTQDTPFSVPDGMEARPEPSFARTSTTAFQGTDSLDEGDFNASVSLSLNIEGFSSAACTSVAQHSQVATKAIHKTALVGSWKGLYSIDVVEPPRLTDEFRAALKTLPIPYAAGDQARFDHFFDNWGTHYLQHGIYGGTFILRTVLSEEDTRSISTSKLVSSVEAGFEAGEGSTKNKAEFERATRKELGTTDGSTTINIYSVGGDSDENEDTWALSIASAPTLLYDALSVSTPNIRPNFEPIWSLCADAKLQATLKQALLVYLPEEAANLPSVFGLPDTTDVSRTFAVESDGFCLVSIVGASGSQSTLSVIVRSGQSGDSEVLNNVKSETWSDPNADRWFTHASVFCPAAKGTWVTQSCLPEDARAHAGFVTTRLLFGPWSTLPKPPEGSFEAPTDGFLALELDEHFPDLAPIYSTLTLDGQVVAFCSAAPPVWRAGFTGCPRSSSLCIPISKGERPVVSPTSDVRTTWLPLQHNAVTFGRLVKQADLVLTNKGCPQSTDHHFDTSMQDQFVFGYIHASIDGCRGTLELFAENANGTADQCYAAASCHWYWDGGAGIPGNSVIMPVRHGQKWTARLSDTWGGGIDAHLFSIPLLPKKG